MLSLKLLLILFYFMLKATAEFTIVPSSVEVNSGQEAVFRCRHSNTSIIWRLNGNTISAANPPSHVTLSSDSLTISAMPAYNGTEIVCVALLSDLSLQLTSPAILTVIGSESPSIATPDEFIVSPEDKTMPEELQAVFECRHNTSATVWRVNGVSVNGNSTHKLGVIFRSNSSINTLSIMVYPEFNQSIVECEAVDRRQSRTAQLWVQGKLVLSTINVYTMENTDHTARFFNISWTSLFSLNLTNIDPDVVYSVNVSVTSCTDRQVIISPDLFKPFFSFSLNGSSPLDAVPHIITVSPRSNAEGAQNGIGAVYEETYIHLENMTSVILVNSENLDGVILQIHFDQRVSDLSGVVPLSYTISLQTVDGQDFVEYQNCPCKLSDDETMLETEHLLCSERLWQFQVYSNDSSCGQNISDTKILSTHFVQNISFSATQPGQIDVSADFVCSNEIGILVIAVDEESSDVQYSVAYRGRMKSATTTLTSLVAAKYNLSVYAINESGLPNTNSAMFIHSEDVVDGGNDDLEGGVQDVYDVKAVQDNSCNGILVKCTFMDDLTSGCVIITHGKKPTFSNYSRGLLNINVRFLQRTDSSEASYCVVDATFADLHVAVFAYNSSNNMIGNQFIILKQFDSSRNSEAGESISIVIVCVIVLGIPLILTILLVVAVLVSWHKNGRNFLFDRAYQERTTEHAYVESTRRTPSSNSSTSSSQPFLRDEHERRLESNSYYERVVGPSSETYLGSDDRMDTNNNSENKFNPPNNEHLPNDKSDKENNPDRVYAEIQNLKSTSENNPDDLNLVIYSDIDQNAVAKPPASQETTSSDPTPTPFTIENILPFLVSIASKWLKLGKVLNLSEKRLDDITTTESDEICLRQMLEVYMMRSDLCPSWVKLVAVLKKIGEERLANRINTLHVYPYDGALPNQPPVANNSTATSTVMSEAVEEENKEGTETVDNVPVVVWNSSPKTSAPASDELRREDQILMPPEQLKDSPLFKPKLQEMELPSSELVHTSKPPVKPSGDAVVVLSTKSSLKWASLKQFVPYCVSELSRFIKSSKKGLEHFIRCAHEQDRDLLTLQSQRMAESHGSVENEDVTSVLESDVDENRAAKTDYESTTDHCTEKSLTDPPASLMESFFAFLQNCCWFPHSCPEITSMKSVHHMVTSKFESFTALIRSLSIRSVELSANSSKHHCPRLSVKPKKLLLMISLMMFITPCNPQSCVTSTTGFLQVPNDAIQAIGVAALFTCQSNHTNRVAIHWIVGHQRVTDAHVHGSGEISTLAIAALPEVNRTEIQCEVTLLSGNGVEYICSPIATLTVQGILAAVADFERKCIADNEVVISWFEPYSMNLTSVTNFQPSAVYCVDILDESGGVFDHSCGQSDTVLNVPYDPTHLYRLFIVYKSNVPGTLEGNQSAPLLLPCSLGAKSIRTRHSGRMVHPIVHLDLSANANTTALLSSVIITMVISSVKSNEPKPMSCQLALSSGLQSGDNIVLEAREDCTLKRGRRYLINIYVTDEYGTVLITEGWQLRTHGISKIKVQANSRRGTITVSAMVDENVTGYLTVACSTLGQCYHKVGIRQHSSNNVVTELHVGEGRYNINVFVLNEFGESHDLPVNEMPNTVQISHGSATSDNSDEPPFAFATIFEGIENCTTGFSASCTAEHLSGCVVVVYNKFSIHSGIEQYFLKKGESREFHSVDIKENSIVVYPCCEAKLQKLQNQKVNYTSPLMCQDSRRGLSEGEIVAIVLGTLGLVTFAILVIVLFLYFSVGYLKSKLIVEEDGLNRLTVIELTSLSPLLSKSGSDFVDRPNFQRTLSVQDLPTPATPNFKDVSTPSAKDPLTPATPNDQDPLLPLTLSAQIVTLLSQDPPSSMTASAQGPPSSTTAGAQDPLSSMTATTASAQDPLSSMTAGTQDPPSSMTATTASAQDPLSSMTAGAQDPPSSMTATTASAQDPPSSMTAGAQDPPSSMTAMTAMTAGAQDPPTPTTADIATPPIIMLRNSDTASNSAVDSLPEERPEESSSRYLQVEDLHTSDSEMGDHTNAQPTITRFDQESHNEGSMCNVIFVDGKGPIPNPAHQRSLSVHYTPGGVKSIGEENQNNEHDETNESSGEKISAESDQHFSGTTQEVVSEPASQGNFIAPTGPSFPQDIGQGHKTVFIKLPKHSNQRVQTLPTNNLEMNDAFRPFSI